MSGQIETLQYENRQLKEQLRKFQEDVEFRLNEAKGAASRPAARRLHPPYPPPRQRRARSMAAIPASTRRRFVRKSAGTPSTPQTTPMRPAHPCASAPPNPRPPCRRGRPPRRLPSPGGDR
ncbi:hypothetical protein ACFQFG_24170 [Methylobacterium persicinum]